MASYFKSVFNPRVIAVFIASFSAGMPIVLVGATLQAWLTKSQVDLSTIGLFSLVQLPFSLKFLWAPFLDHFFIKIGERPFLGKRRGWMVLSQLLLAASLVGMYRCDPAVSAWSLAWMALAVSICGANLEAVVNAYKTELLQSRERDVGAGISYLGYRLGVLLAGAGALGLAVHLSWDSIYLLMSLIIFLALVSSVIAPEPVSTQYASEGIQNVILNPVKEFVSRKGSGWAVAFFILYRLDDSMSLSMATPFLLKSGYTTGELSRAVVSYGLIALVLGTLLGGRAVSRYGIYRCLFVFGFLPTLTELSLYALANTTHHLGLLALWSALEGLSSGLGYTAYTILLMNLCHPAYTATQFALFTSLMALGRITIATPMGSLAKVLGWKAFFLCSIPLALPALLILIRGRFPQVNSSRNLTSQHKS